ncbi:MAG: PQQ-binding-like beta-propeller repeat protein [Cyclobacteriaceae bacterium]
MEKNMLRWTYVCFILLISFGTLAQTLETSWKFESGARVIASPVEKDGNVYVGNEAGIFHAIETSTGKEKWKIETNGNIQAKALIVDDNVFFESANIFYLVKSTSGKVIWKFDTEMSPLSFTYKEKTHHYKIDPFDDKRSGGTLVDGVIYVGSGNGMLYGLDAKTGEVLLSIKSEDDSPIRSSPLVSNGKLFFGDWNGVIYCYELITEKLLWKKKTYRGEKPYGTFGGVVSEFTEYNGLLFFGARNHMLNVLLAETGEKEWTYTDPDGGWMIGDPIIFKDTLYLGGSDNFSMYAFQPNVGRPLWSQNGKKNIYTKPILTEDWLLYTAGNGYDWTETGKLFLLNRMTGEEVAGFETPNGVFSSPVLVDSKVIFGCYDSNVYCVEIKE